ncbi:hypothetical protein ACOME3_008628 [Neoechinorhynchus agilis]
MRFTNVDHASYQIFPNPNLDKMTITDRRGPKMVNQSPTIDSTYGYTGSHHSQHNSQGCYCCEKNNNDVPNNPPPIEPRRSTSRSKSIDDYGVLPTKQQQQHRSKVYSLDYNHPLSVMQNTRLLSADEHDVSDENANRRRRDETGCKGDILATCMYDGKSKVTEC